MARIIAFCNPMSGVGKTTSVANIGIALVRHRRSVLMIYLDPHANLTEIPPREQNIYAAMRGYCSLDDTQIFIGQNIIVHPFKVPKGREDDTVEYLHSYGYIPSSLHLSWLDQELAGEVGRECVLRELIESLENDYDLQMAKKRNYSSASLLFTRPYDFILIDTPPSLGLLTLNALTAADEVLIPSLAHCQDTKGLNKLNETIEVVRKRLNKKLKVGGVFLTQFERGNVAHNKVVDVKNEGAPFRVFETSIRKCKDLADAYAKHTTIFQHSIYSGSAEDYMALSEEILENPFGNE